MIEIRVVSDQYLDRIMEIVAQTTQIMAKQGNDQWDANYPTREIFARDIALQQLYGAYEDDVLLGVICINDQQATEYEQFSWQGDQYLVLHRLVVAPESRGKGIGTICLKYVEELALERGKDSIRSDTNGANGPMLSRFVSLGYEYKGETTLTGHNKRQLFKVFEKVLTP